MLLASLFDIIRLTTNKIWSFSSSQPLTSSLRLLLSSQPPPPFHSHSTSTPTALLNQPLLLIHIFRPKWTQTITICKLFHTGQPHDQSPTCFCSLHYLTNTHNQSNVGKSTDASAVDCWENRQVLQKDNKTNWKKCGTYKCLMAGLYICYRIYALTQIRKLTNNYFVFTFQLIFP